MNAPEPKRPDAARTVKSDTNWGAMTPEQFQNAEAELRKRLRQGEEE